MSDEKNLSNYDYVFALLIALVKREGGEIRLSQKEIEAANNKDVVSLLYDSGSNEILLRTNMLTKPPDDTYLN